MDGLAFSIADVNIAMGLLPSPPKLRSRRPKQQQGGHSAWRGVRRIVEFCEDALSEWRPIAQIRGQPSRTLGPDRDQPGTWKFRSVYL